MKKSICILVVGIGMILFGCGIVWETWGHGKLGETWETWGNLGTKLGNLWKLGKLGKLETWGHIPHFS